MKPTVTVKRKFGDGNNSCTIEFEGVFTPYWGGVRYHRDGSGTPPEPQEFDMNTMKHLDGDLWWLVDAVEKFYDTKMEDFKTSLISKVQSIIERELTKDELNSLKYHYSGETFTEDLCNSLADELQGIEDSKPDTYEGY